MLQDLGFVWQVINPNWMHRYDELVTFKATHGHCRVPFIYECNNPLGRWVYHQREVFKHGRLSKERILMLNELSFEWSVGFVKRQNKANDKKWMNWYQELVIFKAAHGHCRVPFVYECNKPFGRWVHHQREGFKQGRLSEARIEMLNDLSFEWRISRRRGGAAEKNLRCSESSARRRR
jgi:hypothetical protein